MGFPSDSDGKKSACNWGDLGSFPVLGRYLGEDNMTTHSSILVWRIYMDRRSWWAIVHGVTKNWTQLSD